MKQLVILSGKGGTGKTTLSAAMAHLSSACGDPAVIVDADVDAANLHLVLPPKSSQMHEFMGGKIAYIDLEKCNGCGICLQTCRFEAVIPCSANHTACCVDPIACEGCAACAYACPQHAIQMLQQREGTWFHSDTAYGTLFHAELLPGRENSGKLVTLIKQQARLFAADNGLQHIIVDGPPGIGCPVISACAGADLTLMIAEPSLAGIHDLDRILKTVRHFKNPAVVGINKSDIFPAGAQAVKTYCQSEGIAVVGEVDFDDAIPRAMLAGQPVSEFAPNSQAARSMETIWKNVMEILAGSAGA
jgi:MinD superfamily P-loop ATPase